MKHGVKHDDHQVTDKVGLWLAHLKMVQFPVTLALTQNALYEDTKMVALVVHFVQWEVKVLSIFMFMSM